MFSLLLLLLLLPVIEYTVGMAHLKIGIDRLALVDVFSIYVADSSTDAILYVVMCCPI